MHHGGGISPGWQMRIRAMHEFTGRLPKLSTFDREVYNEAVTGTTTADSMYKSTFFGLIAEIDERVEYYKSEFPDLTVILTGGDAHFFEKKLKNSIFAHSNFLLKGIHSLMKENLN
jgi:type III pantothenate kinase